MEKTIKTSFGFKVNASDAKRTTVEFSLDFGKLSEEQIIELAAREVTRNVNNELRDGKIKLEELQGSTIEVKPFESNRGKGAVTEDKALEALAKLHGLSIEALKAMLLKVTEGVK